MEGEKIMYCKICNKPCAPQFERCFKHRHNRKFVVQRNRKTITSVYTEWEMARAFIATHISMLYYKELKIKEI